MRREETSTLGKLRMELGLRKKKKLVGGEDNYYSLNLISNTDLGFRLKIAWFMILTG